MIKKVFYPLAMLAIVSFYACHTEKHEHQEGEHEEVASEEHAHESLSFTKYSSDYELYLEFNPLLVNEKTEFLIHLTRLKDYSPVDHGAVEFNLKGEGVHFSETIEKPEQPGIFKAEWVPEKTADVEITISFINKGKEENFQIKDIDIFQNEEKFEEHAHSQEHQHHEEEHQEGDIRFLKEQAWNTDFNVVEANKVPFAELMKVSGEIQALPTANNKIIANSSGILEYSRENLLPGQVINKGEPLFYIKPGGLVGQNIRTQYLQAKAEFEKNKADYERAKNLVQDQVISQREFSQVKAAYERAKAEYESISSNFRNNGQIITSPIEGVISGLMKDNGAFVSQGDVLAEILNTAHLILKADIPQNAISRLNNLYSANFKTAGGESVYSTDSLNGKLLSVSQITVSENYYLPVFFKIENPGNLIPGTFAEVFLKFGQGQESLVIPRAAIMETEGNYYVYVQKSGETYRRQDVKIGGSDGKLVNILSGLKAGDRVVTTGAYRVKLASMSGELPAHGHSH